MNHPKHEEWVSYLEGEVRPETARKLAGHLATCPECAAEIEGWQRSIGRLKRLPWPEQATRQHAGTRRLFPVLKWAAAAALVLCGGFALGQLSSRNSMALQNTIAARVRAEVRDQTRAELLAALDPKAKFAKDSFEDQLRSAFVSAISARSNRPTEEDFRLLNEKIQALQQGREEDRRNLVAFIDSRFLPLRKDLETAVSMADNGLQQNRLRLIQLAATVSSKANPN